MILEGDCVAVMAAMPEGSVDAVVCDPPYGLGFMGKEWDTTAAMHLPPSAEALDTPLSRMRTGKGPAAVAFDGRAFQSWCEAWAREALRVLKPGGHLLAFGGSRTVHRLACGIEDAGFEVRDCLAWLNGSGFPKSLDVSKAIDKAAGANGEAECAVTAPATPEAQKWDGWGTALKPAHEPIVLARKPLAGTVSANVLKHGTGALNVDGCRVGTDEICAHGGGQNDARIYGGGKGLPAIEPGANPHTGRWPANVILDPEAAALLDEQTGELGPGAFPAARGPDGDRQAYGAFKGQDGLDARRTDKGGASRFFYVAKASSAERNAGLDGFELGEGIGQVFKTLPDQRMDREQERRLRRNIHPTVKPIELMRWLVRLVTPPGGTVLDPFAGSGTTGIACALEGAQFTGIERDPGYAWIAEARIKWWADRVTDYGQLSFE